MNAMVNDHQDDVNAFKDEVKNGKSDHLRDWTKNTLPVIEQHLQSAKVPQNEK